MKNISSFEIHKNSFWTPWNHGGPCGVRTHRKDWLAARMYKIDHLSRLCRATEDPIQTPFFSHPYGCCASLQLDIEVVPQNGQI
jgi:hypothetical protein